MDVGFSTTEGTGPTLHATFQRHASELIHCSAAEHIRRQLSNVTACFRRQLERRDLR